MPPAMVGEREVKTIRKNITLDFKLLSDYFSNLCPGLDLLFLFLNVFSIIVGMFLKKLQELLDMLVCSLKINSQRTS